MTARRQRLATKSGDVLNAIVGDQYNGVLYNVRAILYGLRWPNPWPHTFGYHEFFHAFTAAPAVSHYIAVWFVVL